MELVYGLCEAEDLCHTTFNKHHKMELDMTPLYLNQLFTWQRTMADLKDKAVDKWTSLYAQAISGLKKKLAKEINLKF